MYLDFQDKCMGFFESNLSPSSCMAAEDYLIKEELLDWFFLRDHL